MSSAFRKSALYLIFCIGIPLALASPGPAQTWTYHEDFVDGTGQPDPGGWTAKDFNSADNPPYFECQPYAGRTVLWCGKSDANYLGGSGYGNDWDMWVEKEFTQTCTDPGNPGRIAFDIQYDIEGGYDWIYVMVSHDDRASWGYMAAFTGLSNGFEHYELNWEAWTIGPPVWIRFAFTSDSGWSDDQNGLYPVDSDGAFRLDNVRLIDIRDDSVRDQSDFESGGDLETGFDGWIPGPPVLEPRYVLQPVEFWSDYAPRPDAVPYAWTAIEEPNGLFPDQPVDEPWFYTGIESGRLEIPANADKYTLCIDMYSQQPLMEQLFFSFEVAAPAPEDGGYWRNNNRVYYADYRTWHTRVLDLTPLITPGATSMRVRLSAEYLPYWWPTDGTFTGPGPIFGGVTVEAQTAIQNGALAGRVYEAEDSQCPSPGVGLYGVTVNLFDQAGVAAASLVTDSEGRFAAADLPAGTYTLSLVRPLGYSLASDDLPVVVVGGLTTQADFPLMCLAATGDVRTIGYWKHQVNEAAGGGGLGSGQGLRKGEPAPTDVDSPVCDLLDLIVQHFNDNAINQVRVFEPSAEATCSEKLELALSLLNLQGKQEMIARARQQLMALLLNAAAGAINLTTVVSVDGATLSQAITYCDTLIDGPLGDHEAAKTIADEINNGRLVPAGMIPLDTIIIAYRQPPAALGLHLQNSPNPFNPFTTISFSLAGEADYRLAIYDAAGKLVKAFAAAGRSGRNEVVWDGTDRAGLSAGAGVYFCCVEAEGRRETSKMVLLK